MSADPIIYCLQNLTDYLQFERLCVDLMSSTDYPRIEPLGGSGDRGRDALHISKANPDRITLFAFSVRVDWRDKLLEDCKRITDEAHECDEIVFITTSTITTKQRDEALGTVRDRYGLTLELYAIERIRTLLVGPQRSLIARHPAIFCTPWFDRRGGLLIDEVRDTLVIDHADEDHAFATWLARKLLTFGYPTWCYGTAPLAGENADETIRALIDQRALRYLPILSRYSVCNRDLMDRCALGAAREQLMIPCYLSPFSSSSVGDRIRRLTPASFCTSWSQGLRELIEALNVAGLTRTLDINRGREIAINSYMPETLIRHSSERVFANVFPMTLPSGLVASELTEEPSESAQRAAARKWAFVRGADDVLLSFEPPPADISLPVKIEGRYHEYAWQLVPEQYGRISINVVKELAKKTLLIACERAGFVWCGEREIYYLPQESSKPRRDRYMHVDGRSTWVSLTGERTYRSLDEKRIFKYQLGPIFRVGQDETGAWWVTLRLYVRVTDDSGTPLESSQISKRRKQVTRSWWNKEWFARTLAMIQAISGGTSEIVIGTGRHRVSVCVKPLEWLCPVSIDVLAIDRIGDYQEELAAMRTHDADDDQLPNSDGVEVDG